RERAEPLGELPVVQREVGETFRAALAPRHADHGKMIEHERRLESGADACMDSRTAPLLCHGSVTADPEVTARLEITADLAVTTGLEVMAGLETRGPRSPASRRGASRSTPRARAAPASAPADARSSSRSGRGPSGNTARRARPRKSAQRARR